MIQTSLSVPGKIPSRDHRDFAGQMPHLNFALTKDAGVETHLVDQETALTPECKVHAAKKKSRCERCGAWTACETKLCFECREN